MAAFLRDHNLGMRVEKYDFRVVVVVLIALGLSMRFEV